MKGDFLEVGKVNLFIAATVAKWHFIIIYNISELLTAITKYGLRTKTMYILPRGKYNLLPVSLYLFSNYLQNS